MRFYVNICYNINRLNGGISMTKDEKLAILDELIERATSITYDNGEEMSRCRDEAKSFIRNTISKDSEWLARIDGIR